MILKDPAATEAVGYAIASALKIGDVITLSGTLGAGKSCLARGILRGLGVSSDVPSPTFPIVVTYDPPDARLPVNHVDLYRLKSAEEAYELALDEILEDGALIVEWPEVLGGDYWPEALHISLKEQPDGQRFLTADVPPSWKDRWPF